MNAVNTKPVTVDTAALIAELEKLRSENARLMAAPKRAPSLKVTEKGGLSLYGLGRFPVTLYRSQWEKLIEAVPTIQDFIIANIAVLTEKADK